MLTVSAPHHRLPFQPPDSPLPMLGVIASLWLAVVAVACAVSCSTIPTCASLAKLPAESPARPVWSPNTLTKSPSYLVTAIETQGATVRVHPPVQSCRETPAP